MHTSQNFIIESIHLTLIIYPFTSRNKSMLSLEKYFLFPPPNVLYFPSGLVQNLSGSHDHSWSMILTLRFPLVISQQPLANHGHLHSTTATAHAKGLWSRLTSDTIPPCDFHSSTHLSTTPDFSGLPTGLAPEFHTWPLGLGVSPTHNSNTNKCL